MRLERGGDGARVGDVVAEVGAVVDARRRRASGSKPSISPSCGEAHAVDRRAVGRVADRPVVEVGTSWTHSGRRVVIMRAIAERLPSGAITASSTPGHGQQRAAQRLQALGLDAVVVGEQHAHRSHPEIVAVAHDGEVEPVRGRRVAPPRRADGPRAAPRSPRGSAVRRPPRASCRRGPVHVAHERVGLDPELEQVAALRPAGVVDVALEAHVVGLGRREGREVVRAGQQRRAGVQGVEVERARPPQRAAALEGRALGPVQHAVAVRARAGVAARVEAVGSRRARPHGDVVGEQRVECARRRGGSLVGGDLPQRVHAAVRAPGHGQRHRLAQRPSPAPARARPATVRSPGWRAQPANAAPSYSRSSRGRAGGTATSQP